MNDKLCIHAILNIIRFLVTDFDNEVQVVDVNVFNHDDEIQAMDVDDIEYDDDNDGDIEALTMDDFNEKETFQISRYSPETELKIKIALLIRQVNMNKRDTNILLNIIGGLSTM